MSPYPPIDPGYVHDNKVCLEALAHELADVACAAMESDSARKGYWRRKEAKA